MTLPKTCSHKLPTQSMYFHQGSSNIPDMLQDKVTSCKRNGLRHINLARANQLQGGEGREQHKSISTPEYPHSHQQ